MHRFQRRPGRVRRLPPKPHRLPAAAACHPVHRPPRAACHCQAAQQPSHARSHQACGRPSRSPNARRSTATAPAPRQVFRQAPAPYEMGPCMKSAIRTLASAIAAAQHHARVQRRQHRDPVRRRISVTQATADGAAIAHGAICDILRHRRQYAAADIRHQPVGNRCVRHAGANRHRRIVGCSRQPAPADD